MSQLVYPPASERPVTVSGRYEYLVIITDAKLTEVVR